MQHNYVIYHHSGAVFTTYDGRRELVGYVDMAQPILERRLQARRMVKDWYDNNSLAQKAEAILPIRRVVKTLEDGPLENGKDILEAALTCPADVWTTQDGRKYETWRMQPDHAMNVVLRTCRTYRRRLDERAQMLLRKSALPEYDEVSSKYLARAHYFMSVCQNAAALHERVLTIPVIKNIDKFLRKRGYAMTWQDVRDNAHAVYQAPTDENGCRATIRELPCQLDLLDPIHVKDNVDSSAVVPIHRRDDGVLVTNHTDASLNGLYHAGQRVTEQKALTSHEIFQKMNDLYERDFTKYMARRHFINEYPGTPAHLVERALNYRTFKRWQIQ